MRTGTTCPNGTSLSAGISIKRRIVLVWSSIETLFTIDGKLPWRISVDRRKRPYRHLRRGPIPFQRNSSRCSGGKARIETQLPPRDCSAQALLRPHKDGLLHTN
jgi:hypothetical protein